MAEACLQAAAIAGAAASTATPPRHIEVKLPRHGRLRKEVAQRADQGRSNAQAGEIDDEK